MKILVNLQETVQRPTPNLLGLLPSGPDLVSRGHVRDSLHVINILTKY
ncbi:MAG: hypothetical protein TECD_00094 [Hyphomicrobiaceae bacterium hypho_1]